jgi:hypothetical protein
MTRVRGSGYDGLIDEPYVTFATALTASSVGKAVKPSASYNEAVGITVALVTEGDQISGRLTRVEDDGVCAVQESGYCTLPFVAGATPSIDSKIVGGATDGTVKTDNDKGRHLVYSIDNTNLLARVKLD